MKLLPLCVFLIRSFNLHNLKGNGNAANDRCRQSIYIYIYIYIYIFFFVKLLICLRLNLSLFWFLIYLSVFYEKNYI